MPINLFDSPLSSIKLGDNSILKGYIGNGQIFPNDTEITAAAFTNANIANTGGNTPYVVSGEIGASFTLTGSIGATAPSGTQVISASPSTYQIAIGANTGCNAASRNSQVVIAPQGNTVLAGGLSNTDTIIQAAGPSSVSNVTTITMSSTGSGPTVNIGGQLRWAVGAVLTTTFSVTTNYTLGGILMNIDGDGGSYYSGQFFSIANGGISPQAWDSTSAAQVNWTTGNSSLNGMNGSVTYTYNGYNGGGNATAMRSTIQISGINCEIPTVTSASTIAYP